MATISEDEAHIISLVEEEKRLFVESFGLFITEFKSLGLKLPPTSVEGFASSAKHPLVKGGNPTKCLIGRLNGIIRGYSSKCLENADARALLCLYARIFGMKESPFSALNIVHAGCPVSYHTSRFGSYLSFTADTLEVARVQVAAIGAWYTASQALRKGLNKRVNAANKAVYKVMLVEHGVPQAAAQAKTLNLRQSVRNEDSAPESESDSSASSGGEETLAKIDRRGAKGKVKTKKLRTSAELNKARERLKAAQRKYYAVRSAVMGGKVSRVK